MTTTTKYDERHGGPYDRGGADYYYRRGYKPHYYVGGTMTSQHVPQSQMTEDEIDAYRAGFDDAAACGDQKDYL